MCVKNVKRGDVYYAYLPEREGSSAQYGIRPVLCIQNNCVTRNSPTVIVAAITSQIKRLDLRTHVLLPEVEGLPRESMVEAEQRFTLGMRDLLQYRCTLDDATMRRVHRAVRFSEKKDGMTYRQRYRKGRKRK